MLSWTKTLKVCQEYIPTPLHYPTTCRVDPNFLGVHAKFHPNHPNVTAETETHHTRQELVFLKFSVVWFWWAHVNFSLFFLFLADMTGMQYRSAAVDHLLQSPTCNASRDALLHTLAVTDGYLTSSQLKAVWSFSCDINTAFSSRQLVITGYRVRDMGKSQWVSSSWNTQSSLSGTNDHFTFKAT